MKNIFYLLTISIFLMACSPTVNTPVDNIEYGKGIYILTENSVSFYDITDSTIKENIFSNENGQFISNSSSLYYYSNQKSMFIVTENTLYSVDIETFKKNFEVSGFINAKECEYASFDRLYVTDMGVSEIKVVDLNIRDISAHIETGFSMNPTSMVMSSNRAFVINSGGVDLEDYDSTLVAVNIRDGVIPLNDFAGNIIIGKNPTSVLINGSVIVLCKGIFDPNNTTNNIESSIYTIGAGSLNIQDMVTLNGVYNADNMFLNQTESRLYFTALDGVYYANTLNFGVSLVTNKRVPDVLISNREFFFDVTDSTNKLVDFLYMNDLTVNNYLYKYNAYLNTFVDSFMLSSPVVDIEIYR